MANSTVKGTSGISKPGLTWINFPGYDESEGYGIAAAVVVPLNRRLVATSGHVARDSTGKHPEESEDEFKIAFERVEKSIQAVDPSLGSEEIWGSVYQITTYHAGGISAEIFDMLVNIANKLLRGHRPAWTAVEVKNLNGGVRFEIAVQAAIP